MSRPANQPSPPAQRRAPVPACFLPTAISVGTLFGFLVLILSLVVTFLLPEYYRSTARLMIRPAAGVSPAAMAQAPQLARTQVQLLTSQQVLGPVIEQLDLNRLWAKQLGLGNEKLKTTEAAALLKRHLDVRQVAGTAVLEVRMYSSRPAEAAQIANRITEIYRRYCYIHFPEIEVAVIDQAVPGLRPVRPNKPLNIALGFIAGVFASAFFGSLTFLLRWWAVRRRDPDAASPRTICQARRLSEMAVPLFAGVAAGIVSGISAAMLLNWLFGPTAGFFLGSVSGLVAGVFVGVLTATLTPAPASPPPFPGAISGG